jgi:hypothetical protein
LQEDLVRHESIAAPSERNFGLTIGTILGLIGAVRLYYGHSHALWILGLGVVLAALALLSPAVLAPLNRLWALIGLALNKVVNPVVMTVLYCVTIVPMGVVMRLRGKDPLRLKYDAAAKSYWIMREPPGPAPETMRNQF